MAADVGQRRCRAHRRAAEAARGSRHERGYGSTHERRRAALMADIEKSWGAGLRPACWRCGAPMLPGQALDADHSGVLASSGGVADVLAHAWCNRAKRGGRTRTPPDYPGGGS